MTTANTLAALVNSSSEVVVPSGGINFGTSTDGTGTVSSGVMDDYEQGTYSPEYKTNGDSLSGVTYDVQVGYYIKTGSFVYVSIQLRYDVTGTFSATSGNLTVTLPFTCGSSGRGGGFRTYASAWNTNTPDVGYILSGTDSIQLMDGNTTLNNLNLYTSGINRNFLNLHVIYPTS